jgi:hypothetical protein
MDIGRSTAGLIVRVNWAAFAVILVASVLIVGGSSRAGWFGTHRTLLAHRTPTIACGNPGTTGDFSACFTGNTPFHHSVASLLAAGGTVVGDGAVANSSAANFFAAEGMGMYSSNLGSDYPMWTTAVGNTALAWPWRSSTGNIYLPAYAGNQCRDLSGTPLTGVGSGETACNYDYHVMVSDQVHNNSEIDGEACGPNQAGGAAAGSGLPTLNNCMWGASYLYTGSGLSADLATKTDGAIGGQFAPGLAMITPGDLNSASPINHALTVISDCAVNPTIYPSTISFSSDLVCTVTPNISYGNLIAIKPSVNVATLGGSPECQKILTAGQKYGWYIEDTSAGWGITVNDLEAYQDYFYAGVSPNPWDTHIASMAAAGDGSGSGAAFFTYACWNRLSASNIEVIQLNQNGGNNQGTAALPAIGVGS